MDLDPYCSANSEITVLKFTRKLKGSQTQADICIYVALRLRSSVLKTCFKRGKEGDLGWFKIYVNVKSTFMPAVIFVWHRLQCRVFSACWSNALFRSAPCVWIHEAFGSAAWLFLLRAEFG